MMVKRKRPFTLLNGCRNPMIDSFIHARPGDQVVNPDRDLTEGCHGNLSWWRSDGQQNDGQMIKNDDR